MDNLEKSRSRVHLRSSRVIDVVLNDQKAADRLREAIGELGARGHRVELSISEKPGDATERAAAAARRGADVIVAAGGDGTLNEVVQGVHDAGALGRCAVGVIPLGTANDFASACGIPLGDPHAALELAATVAPSPIDVGMANGRLFVNAASGGHGARVTTETPDGMKRYLSSLAYYLTGLASITKLESRPAKVAGPDFEWEGELVGFVVGNGRRAGGGFNVASKALLNDGLLDLILFQEISLEVVTAVARDRLPSPFEDCYEPFTEARLPWLEITTPDSMQVNLDGEATEGTSFRFEILEERAHFCLPGGAPLA